MKLIFYMIYALLFYIYSVVPQNDNKTTFIMTHDSSINGNIMCIYSTLKKKQPNHVCKFITKKQLKNTNKIIAIKEFLKFIIFTPYHLATSKTIFLDNVFLPMAFIRFKNSTKVVQLWHGCNTLKKFGQLSNTGFIRLLEKKSNSRYTHVIVSSRKMINLHKEAFGVKEEVIYPLGLPRMDIFFDKLKIEKEKKIFFEQFKELKNKKIILYAPTFRDNKTEVFDDNMNLESIARSIPDNYIIINKFHPFVSNVYGQITSNKMLNLSHYEDLTRLLLVADILITDYSSIIFEYALLQKPMIFYSYDEEEYRKSIRGFYYDYEKYINVKVIRSKEGLLDAILNPEVLNYKEFTKRYVEYKDSNSACRLYENIYLN